MQLQAAIVHDDRRHAGGSLGIDADVARVDAVCAIVVQCLLAEDVAADPARSWSTGAPRRAAITA